MKIFLLGAFFSLLLTSEKCAKKTSAKNCLKGRLEIKGLCSNYTIRLVEGSIDTSLISPQWVNEETNKTYKNVFGLDSPCSFPEDIREGEEFYFTIRNDKDKDCNVCMAYYPTPPKRLAISASKNACP